MAPSGEGQFSEIAGVSSAEIGQSVHLTAKAQYQDIPKSVSVLPTL